jgi:hypothetical protein
MVKRQKNRQHNGQKTEEQTTQWSKEEEQTTQWSKEEGQKEKQLDLQNIQITLALCRHFLCMYLCTLCTYVLYVFMYLCTLCIYVL